MSANAPIITFDHVDKFYGDFHALKDISISVREGERMVVCGPSGSGKSTLIRCINGLEFHNSGVLTVDGIDVYEDSKNIFRLRQEVGMVFQQFNLFPHLTVLENLTIGPIKVRKVSPAEAEKTARKYLERSAFRNRRTNTPPPCQAANSSVSRLPGRCVWKAGSCCSMNRPLRLIPR